MSPSSASTGSKSSARQVQTSENRWRVTVIVSVMPRLSSSSAMSAAERVVVPRSMTRDSSHVAPGAPGRIARRTRRARQVDRDRRCRRGVSFARTHDAVVEDGADGCESGLKCELDAFSRVEVGLPCRRQRLEPADGAVGRRRSTARAAAATSSTRHRGDPRRQRRRTRRRSAMVSKYPSWCAMFVTLSLSNTSRACSCAWPSPAPPR